MNVFLSGEKKTAKCTISAYPAGIDCTVELYLTRDMVNKDATTGVVHFTSAEETSLALEITMPAGGYWYEACLDVNVGGLVTLYRATEPVAVPLVGEPTIIWE